MSLFAQRFAATCVVLWVMPIAALQANADVLPDSTWIALKAVPHQGRSALFALAVDPASNQNVIVGTSDGTLLRSTDGGTKWTIVHSVRSPFITIAFHPYVGGVVVAGTRGAGALISRDSGATWTATAGLESRSVRGFAFALTLIAAGTDRGVYLSSDGASWAPSNLTNRSINTLAVVAIHSPVRLVAGGDAQGTGGGLPLFQSIDAGSTWTQLNPPVSGTIAVKLAAGPLPPTGNVRPLVLGTNTGLFESTDNGATFTAVSGGGVLPTTDYTQVAFIADHYDHFYVASDGGGSGSGGLWRTYDGGQTFTSLQPPQASVTALAISNDENPTLYVATFRPADHTPSMWVYQDTGTPPQGPPATPTVTASGSRGASQPGGSSLTQLFSSPQLPYIGLGLGAIAVILTAVVAHLRGRRR